MYNYSIQCVDHLSRSTSDIETLNDFLNAICLSATSGFDDEDGVEKMEPDRYATSVPKGSRFTTGTLDILKPAIPPSPSR